MEGTVLSLLPPLVAIVLCILLREAILSLFIGIYVGALLLYSFAPLTALFRSVDDVILSSFVDPDHAVTLLFTILIGGLIEIFNRSPSAGLVLAAISRRLRDRRMTSLTVWLAGVIFFIDDYANSLIIGNSFRGLADRVRISREKLAFLVDTTSAPVTSLMLVSTWIGFEISIINDALTASGNAQYSGYNLFLSSIPYRFYPVLAIFFALMICLSRRDYGPMARAEAAALSAFATQSHSPETRPHAHRRDALVFLPILFLLISSIVMLAVDGSAKREAVPGETVWQVLLATFSAADAFRCLLWASLLACLLSFVVHILILRESFRSVFENWMDGNRGMFNICVILVLAWSIGDICRRMGTDAYVASLLGEGFNPAFLPVVTFLVAAGISFATGTSFGTMSILIPITLPLAFQYGAENPDILLGTVGSVLGGAIFGDHCSPLSDTTILSSGASGCTVAAHVNTQMPYALTTGVAALGCLLLIPLGIFPSLLLLLAGMLFLGGVLYFYGENVEDEWVPVEVEAEFDAPSREESA
jgi:Na+/H+ antiporter NhaC